MWIILILFYFLLNIYLCADVCFTEDNCVDSKRYLLYDINSPEGFNLRRDVYLRLAVLAHEMKESKNTQLNSFQLVLPPWSYLVHWEFTETPEYIPWGYYFDVESLQRFAPVIEMYEFFKKHSNKYSKVKIDEVFILQHFEDMFTTGNFQDKMEITTCNTQQDLSYFFYNNITSNIVQCLSFHGPATKLTNLFLNSTAKTILIHHAEVVLHDYFGSKIYWQARRSMRFNNNLIKIARIFRKKYLNSTDEHDNTILPDDWMDEKLKRTAIGGPYVGIHLRRRDFIRSRSKEVPTLNSVASQIKTILRKLNLNAVFVATDGSDQEFLQLSELLNQYTVFKYSPDYNTRKKYRDGGVAIIDQIICSYARYFIGTHESTFTFRIQEEREIIGFPVETTFNVFCSNNVCPKPSIWKIVY